MAPTKARLLWKEGNPYLTRKGRHRKLLRGGTCSGLQRFSIIRTEIKQPLAMHPGKKSPPAPPPAHTHNNPAHSTTGFTLVFPTWTKPGAHTKGETESPGALACSGTTHLEGRSYAEQGTKTGKETPTPQPAARETKAREKPRLCPQCSCARRWGSREHTVFFTFACMNNHWSRILGGIQVTIRELKIG